MAKSKSNDKSKNTGTGGINIDGKVYTPDVGVPDSQGGAQGAWSSGDISVDKEEKDFSKPTKETFAKYLSKTTLAAVGSSTHKNVYPVGSGEQTTLATAVLKEPDGTPVGPSKSINESNFSPDFSSTIATHPPMPALRRGIAPGDAPDGNQLLPAAAVPAPSGGPYIKPAKSLDPNIKEYTKEVLVPNLYSPLDESPAVPNVIIGDGGNILPENLRDLYKTTNIKKDAGTFDNVIKKSFIDEAKLVSDKTVINKYPVDSPVISTELNVVKLDSSTTLALTKNTKFFKNVGIGVSKAINSKGKLLIIGTGNRTLPDGNFLLPFATPEIPAGEDYIKFIGAAYTYTPPADYNPVFNPLFDPNKGLQEPIRTYTKEVLKPNRYNPWSDFLVPDVVMSDGTLGIGPKNLRPLRYISEKSSVVVDGGTSKNILGSAFLPFQSSAENDYTLYDVELATLASKETQYNAYAVDPPSVDPKDPFTFSFFNFYDTEKLFPRSPSDDQANPQNSQYYTKNVGLPSSYSKFDAFLNLNRGRSAAPWKDGNSLLLTATKKVIIPPSGEADPLGGEKVVLDAPIDKYLAEQLKNNVYQPEDPALFRTMAPFDGNFFGPGYLHRTQDVDLGSFNKIVTGPERRYSKNDALAALRQHIVGAENVPGNLPNEYTPFDTKDPASYQVDNESTIFDSKQSLHTNGYPNSPTVAQSIIDESATWKYEPDITGISSYTDAATGLKIKRGKSDFLGPNGNELLKDATKKAPVGGAYVKPAGELNDPIKGYVSEVLKKNRFSDSRRFAPVKYLRGDAISMDDDERKSFDQNATFARPDQLAFGESGGNDAIGGARRDYGFKRLAQVSSVLQLRATGEFIALAQDNVNPSSDLTSLAALAPGVGQSAIPLSTSILTAEDVLKELTEETIEDIQYIDPNGTFNGVINSVFDKFSGFSSIGMLVLGAVLVLVIVLAFEGIAALINLNSKSQRSSSEAERNKYGNYGIGNYSGKPALAASNIADALVGIFGPNDPGSAGERALRLFGIIPTTNYPLRQALDLGIKSFFGLGDKFEPTIAVQYPGQLVIMTRTLVRAATQLVLAFKDLIEQFATGNIYSGIERILDIIDTIRSSKIISAINVFSRVGDLQSVDINTGAMSFDVTKKGLDNGKKISLIDSIPQEGGVIQGKPPAQMDDIYPNPAVSKSRLGIKITEGESTDEKLAWSTSLSPSLRLIPNNKQRLARALGSKLEAGLLSDTDVTVKIGDEITTFGFTNVEYKNPESDPNIFNATGTRFSDAFREEYENRLDSEYVPFYFHDLRTNEIVSFHAFLASLTDEYSADYESTTGFGRIEPVKTYRSTTRKVGLSFYVVALDQNDFKWMWDQINKLTTLIYPQYTTGKLYEHEDYRFEKPFSQQIAASPMIRLRVGNLFASNYSKFNLAGIFGLHNDEAILNEIPRGTAQLNEYKQKKEAAAAAAVEAKYKSESAAYDADPKNRYKEGYLYSFFPHTYLRGQVKNDGLKQAPATQEKAIDAEPGTAADIDNKFIEFRARAVHNDIFYFKISEVDFENKIVKGGFVFRTDEARNKVISKAQEGKYAAFVAAALTWVAPFDKLDEMAPETKKAYEDARPVKGEIQKKQVSYSAEVATFLAEDKNAIVKSFRSAGGKGLAGFIDSLSFDWYDKVTWDIESGRKAPKMCKVTISFSPVHDISPGLDAYGHNRAPIYPVGFHQRTKIR